MSCLIGCPFTSLLFDNIAPPRSVAAFVTAHFYCDLLDSDYAVSGIDIIITTATAKRPYVWRRLIPLIRHRGAHLIRWHMKRAPACPAGALSLHICR